MANKKIQLTGSEAVFGFAAWLTTRIEITMMSSRHDSAPIAELVSEFIDTNGLEDPRENWEKILKHPDK